MKSAKRHNIHEPLQRFERICRAKGLRLTHQRSEIYRELAKYPGHPTAENVFKKVRKRLKTISLDTVYRTITTFENYGLIKRIQIFDNTARFDINISVHHHLVCIKCKKIEDFCGKEVLRRILGGSEISKAEYHGMYYRKAKQVKEMIKKEFEKSFEKVDCIIMPTVPKLPHKIGKKLSVEDMYVYDTLTAPANLAEIPAISIPAGKISGIPVGLQILCPRFQEGKMFSIGGEFE